MAIRALHELIMLGMLLLRFCRLEVCMTGHAQGVVTDRQLESFILYSDFTVRIMTADARHSSFTMLAVCQIMRTLLLLH